MATATPSSTFSFSFGAALNENHLYVAGVANELEDRDVPHTILWERLNGEWKRYQWKNRTYAMAAYSHDGGGTVIYMGYEGTLKVRSSVHGSSEELLELGDEGPSSLLTVSSIRVVGDQLYVSGTRRMVYRRPLSGLTWSRFDNGLRQKRSDLKPTALYSIDGHDPLHLYAVGMGGEIWRYVQVAWHQIDSPTNLTLLTVRCLPSERVVVGGEKGALWVSDGMSWSEVAHTFAEETFSCVEHWCGRCFVASDAGNAYELKLGATPSLVALPIDGLPSVSWISATASRIYFVGSSSVVSLGDNGWQDESPPISLTS
jgi:hypothetical protein